MINKEKQALMFARVKEWEKSGMTIRDFASDLGLSKSCLEYWIRRKRDLTSNSLQFVELIPSFSPTDEKQQSVKTNEPIAQAQIVFTFPGGLCVKVYA